MKRILLALSILLGFQTFAFSQGLPAPSLWQNQRGSTLEINFANPAGSFQGIFTNQASGFECKGIPYPAAGGGKNNAVVFWVSFAQCSSFTVWYGRVNGTTMNTNWTLTYIKQNGSPGTLQGTDVFTRVR